MSKSGDFFAGVCVALQQIACHDNGVIWKEVVQLCGEDDLLYYAAHIEPDEWGLAGFRMYARSELGKSKPRKKVKKAPSNVLWQVYVRRENDTLGHHLLQEKSGRTAWRRRTAEKYAKQMRLNDPRLTVVLERA